MWVSLGYYFGKGKKKKYIHSIVFRFICNVKWNSTQWTKQKMKRNEMKNKIECVSICSVVKYYIVPLLRPLPIRSNKPSTVHGKKERVDLINYSETGARVEPLFLARLGSPPRSSWFSLQLIGSFNFIRLAFSPPRKYYSNNSINFNSSADYHINFITTLFGWRPYFAFYVHLRKRHWGSPSIVNDLCKAIIKMEVK